MRYMSWSWPDLLACPDDYRDVIAELRAAEMKAQAQAQQRAERERQVVRRGRHR